MLFVKKNINKIFKKTGDEISQEDIGPRQVVMALMRWATHVLQSYIQ